MPSLDCVATTWCQALSRYEPVVLSTCCAPSYAPNFTLPSADMYTWRS